MIISTVTLWGCKSTILQQPQQQWVCVQRKSVECIPLQTDFEVRFVLLDQLPRSRFQSPLLFNPKQEDEVMPFPRESVLSAPNRLGNQDTDSTFHDNFYAIECYCTSTSKLQMTRSWQLIYRLTYPQQLSWRNTGWLHSKP